MRGVFARDLRGLAWRSGGSGIDALRHARLRFGTQSDAMRGFFVMGELRFGRRDDAFVYRVAHDFLTGRAATWATFFTGTITLSL